MNSFTQYAGAMAVALVFAPVAQADVGTLATQGDASFNLTINGAAVALTDTMQTDAQGDYTYDFSTGGSEIATIVVSGNVDPFISFSLGNVTATSTPTTYSFGFSKAVSPALLGPTQIKASLQGVLTNNINGGTPSVAPSPAGGNVLTAYVTNNGGTVQLGVPAGGSMGPMPASPSGTQFTYGPYYVPGPASSDLTAGPAGVGSGITLLGFNTSFTVSPNASFSENGRVEIDPVPEPGAWGMVAAGVGMLGLLARRRLRDLS